MELRRIALTAEQMNDLLSFSATDKSTNIRYKCFTAHYGDRCWQHDVMDLNDLRNCVDQEIVDVIEPVVSKNCELVLKARGESLYTILGNWFKKMKLKTLKNIELKRG